MWKRELKSLIQWTRGCGEDMHEPDEAGVYVELVDGMLDNAGGSGEAGFYLIRDDGKRKRKSQFFNLANIIALARKAKI